MKNEKTLVLIKPDGIQRSLVGEIISRFERSGLKLVGFKMIVPDSVFIEKHYLVNPNWKTITGAKSIEAYKKQGKNPPYQEPEAAGNFILNKMKEYLSSSPVIAIVLQGVHSVGIVRKLVGSTEPLTSDVGTIRGDLTIDSYELADADQRAVRNLVHASGSVEEAEKEIILWFNKEELHDYKLMNEKVLYERW